jgi:CheY-like chemotaxis protein
MSQTPQASPSPLVLVVDDIEDNRDLYAQYLRFAGYRVEQAASGFEALTKVPALHPDLVVMDLSMPGLDGCETTRRLKADPATRKTPVIALTGHSADHSKTEAMEAGCAGYLTKPCLPEDLVAVIAKVLK